MAVLRPTRFSAFIALALTALLLWRGIPPAASDAHTAPVFDATRPRIQFTPSSFNWSSAEYHPVSSFASLPKGKPKALPKVQHRFSAQNRDSVTEERRKTVRHVFLRSLTAYKQQAWGWDELQPVTGGGKNAFGGWAATLVDALDTVWIMELYDEFYEAAQYCAQLDWANTRETSANMFEVGTSWYSDLASTDLPFQTTIRHLGGLLSAYDLSREPALLEKAHELGEMLYMAFDTPNRMPGFWLDWEQAKSGTQTAGTNDPSASPASLSLEFTRLAQLTGNDKYYDAIERIRKFLAESQERSRLPGLMPEIFDMFRCPSKEACDWDPVKWDKEGDKRLTKGFKTVRDAKYILRPEAIESVFYLYRVTGQEDLRDIAWQMFESIIKSTETSLAYSAISDVTATGETHKQNSMEVSTEAQLAPGFF
ncbi:hypothetical protein Daus18300_000362 [Diaporthe australafricana]|uniref:alpha-1,2-Mannosidase n=1 Tax=Diaporthe australafricana TaxID=127596 RepID=A0ABR3Y5L4_9PEZI